MNTFDKVLFVGEERSELAKTMGLTWKDGGLAAKQLFDAMKASGFDPETASFTNLFERGGIKTVKEWEGIVIGMGHKVCNDLKKRGFNHTFLTHPAARGRIRKKERYFAHFRQVMLQAGIL